MAKESHDTEMELMFPGREGGLIRQSNFSRRTFRKCLEIAVVPLIRPLRPAGHFRYIVTGSQKSCLSCRKEVGARGC